MGSITSFRATRRTDVLSYLEGGEWMILAELIKSRGEHRVMLAGRAGDVRSLSFRAYPL